VSDKGCFYEAIIKDYGKITGIILIWDYGKFLDKTEIDLIVLWGLTGPSTPVGMPLSIGF